MEELRKDFSLVEKWLGAENHIGGVGLKQVGECLLPFLNDEDFKYPN